MKKQAALELSITTIIVIVLAVVMLILGIVFVKSIMCAGIVMGEEITTSTQKEIRSLFQGNDIGVKCMGESDQEVKIGSSGRRKIGCTIIVDEETEYELNLALTDIESLKGANEQTVQKWVLDRGWEGAVSPGKDGTTVTVLFLDIPAKAATTTLKLTIKSENKNTGTSQTHISYIDIVSVGWFKGSIC